jgi:hypothetical protein
MLLKEDLKVLNINRLKKLCKKKLIPNYSKMKKNELFNECNKVLAVKIIQKQFRNHFYRNAMDSITLENVKFPCFIYRVKCGKIFFYDYSSIIKYIMKSGKVIDPNTRNEYTDNELIRLDNEAKFHFPTKNFKSTYKIKKNETYARRIRNRENEILSFQMRMDEIKASILTIIEDNIISWNLTDPIIIENVEYRNFNSYLNSIIHELNILFINLKSYSEFESNCYKTTFLTEINTFSEGTSKKYFLNIISKF